MVIAINVLKRLDNEQKIEKVSKKLDSEFYIFV